MVCYVPTTSAGLPRVSFIFSFLFLLLQPLTVPMSQTRQAVHAIKQSIFLDVYALSRCKYRSTAGRSRRDGRILGPAAGRCSSGSGRRISEASVENTFRSRLEETAPRFLVKLHLLQ
jgi:hypothetical protein